MKEIKTILTDNKGELKVIPPFDCTKTTEPMGKAENSKGVIFEIYAIKNEDPKSFAWATAKDLHTA